MAARLLVLFLVIYVSCCFAATGFWCANAPSSPGDRRPNKDQLTVVTYNAEWLFLNATNKCPAGMCPWEDEDQAWEHLEIVADVIRSLNADIVNLVEVQDCNTLSALNERIGSSFGYRIYLVQGTDTATGQNVALLTRVDPIQDLQRYQEDGKDIRVEWPVSGEKCNYGQQGGYTSVSKHYYTRVGLKDESGADAGVVSLIGLHFLAFPTDPARCAQREGQAMVIQQLIEQELDAGNQVIAFGDLNDYDGVVLDANSDEPTSRVLSFLKAPGLYATSSDVTDQENRYSAWWDQNGDCKITLPKEVSTIDHLLCSEEKHLHPDLYKSLKSAEYVHSYMPECDPQNFESDHWPVVAVFDIKSLAAARAAQL